MRLYIAENETLAWFKICGIRIKWKLWPVLRYWEDGLRCAGISDPSSRIWTRDVLNAKQRAVSGYTYVVREPESGRRVDVPRDNQHTVTPRGKGFVEHGANRCKFTQRTALEFEF
jgi:hypothetical protein